MVRDREIKAEQAEHAGDEPFSLAQGQVEDEPQGQHQLDRQVRIASLSARCGSPWGLPSGDGCLVEPEDQVTAPFQSSIVLSPVPDPVPCPEALGSVWVWSEGHDGHQGWSRLTITYPVGPPRPTSLHQRPQLSDCALVRGEPLLVSAIMDPAPGRAW